MGIPIRSGNIRKPNESMRLIIATFCGSVFGFILGVSFPSLSVTKMNLPSSLFPSIDLTYIEDKYSRIPTKAIWGAWNSFRGNESMSNGHQKLNETTIWVPTNPRGAERLPPGIVKSESDYYLRRLWGLPDEDLSTKPKYLIAFTVGYDQKENIDAAVKKFSEDFTIVLFHYDGRASEWDQLEWSKQAIHISVRKQTKWYLKLVRKHGLEISQPGLDPSSSFTWQMTMRREDSEVHKDTEERNGWCTNPHMPPCAAFVEIMAPVFSRNAWRCVWHMIQNDLIHGWGLDFALRKCVEPPHQKIGVVDTQWVIHQSVPSLGNQGQSDEGKQPWEGVRARCHKEWTMFQERMSNAESAYFQSMGMIALHSIE